MNKIFFPISFLLFSCTPKEGGIYPEGSQAGDCTDGADNDIDGDFDCDTFFVEDYKKLFDKNEVIGENQGKYSFIYKKYFS